MSGLLPASPTARRAELDVREKARIAALDRMSEIERKLDIAAAAGKGAGSDAPLDPRVEALSIEMADRLWHAPANARVSTTMTDDGVRATGLTLENRFWSVEDIIECGMINPHGAWLWGRYAAICAALVPADAHWTVHAARGGRL